MSAGAALDFATLARASESASQFQWLIPDKKFSRQCPLCAGTLKVALIGGQAIPHCSGGCAKDEILAELGTNGETVREQNGVFCPPLVAAALHDVTSWKTELLYVAKAALENPKDRKWLEGGDRQRLEDALHGDLHFAIEKSGKRYQPPAELSASEVEEEVGTVVKGALDQFLPPSAPTVTDDRQMTPVGQGRRPMGFAPANLYLDRVAARQARKPFWQGLVYAGDTVMLCGRAFAGKSTFAASLVRSLTLGIPFLGRPCARARCGYLALERNGVVVARLFERWGIAEAVEFLDYVPPMPGPKLAEFLEEEIARRNLDVIVADHLQNLLRVEDSNSYSAVELAMEPLNAVARRTGKVPILLHHQGKTAALGDEINVMGSEAFRGCADVMIEATQSNRQYYIKVQTRGESNLSRTRVTIDPATGEAGAIDAREIEAREAETAIAEFLKTQPEGADSTTIRAEVGLNAKLVGIVLKEAADGRRLRRDGTGKKGDAYVYHVPDFASDPYSQNRGIDSQPTTEYGAVQATAGDSKMLFPLPVGKGENRIPDRTIQLTPIGQNSIPESSESNRKIGLPGNESAPQTRPEVAAPGNAGMAGNARKARIESAPGDADPDFVPLLGDIRMVFDEKQTDRMSAEVLCQALHEIEGRRWAQYGPSQLSQLLDPFRIASHSIRLSYDTTDATVIGYERADFAEAFARYLSAPNDGALISDDSGVDTDFEVE